VLKWARENGCPWDDRVCSRAAQGGYLEVVKWAREQGCEWNWTIEDFKMGGEERVSICR